MRISAFAVTTVTVALLCGTLFAGPLTHEQGDVVLQGGVGFGMLGWYGSVVIPPVSAAIEYGFHDVISAGPTVAYGQTRDYYGYSYYGWEYSYTYTAVGVRACFHPLSFPDFPEFPLSDKIDLYGGGVVGAVLVSYTVEEPIGYMGDPIRYQTRGNYPLFGAFVGGRYYFVPHLAAVLEMGAGLGYVNFALAARF